MAQLKMCHFFDSYQSLYAYIQNFCDKNFHPLVVFRHTERYATFKCTHGVKYKCKSKGLRSAKAIRYVGCKAEIKAQAVTKRPGKWAITSKHLEHTNHKIGKQEYLRYPQQKHKVVDSQSDNILKMVQSKVKDRRIAKIVSRETGVSISRRHIENFRKSQVSTDANSTPVITIAESDDDIVEVPINKEDVCVDLTESSTEYDQGFETDSDDVEIPVATKKNLNKRQKYNKAKQYILSRLDELCYKLSCLDNDSYQKWMEFFDVWINSLASKVPLSDKLGDLIEELRKNAVADKQLPIADNANLQSTQSNVSTRGRPPKRANQSSSKL